MNKKRNLIEAMYPLSPMQQGMLFHTLYDSEAGMYVEQTVLTLHGDVDIAIFQRALQRVVERHPVFRTVFIWEQRDEPFQVVYPQVPLTWLIEDWRDTPADEQEPRLTALLDADRTRGFVLTQAPLMRMMLLRTADQTYQFVWTQHHLLMDGWSLPLVLNEIFAFYEAFVQGHDLSLPLPRPYRDYIAWLQRQDLSGAEAFWRQTLAGFTTPTPLVVDRPVGSGAGIASYGDKELLLDEPTSTALQVLARRHGLTLNTLVQGAWALLLGYYSGEDDVLFGVTVAGRPAELSGVETMVGLFLNTLPVRVRLNPNAVLLDWLREVQAAQVDLRQYEYSPLVQVQGWSEVPRGQQLFESLVVFENYPVDNVGAQQNGHATLTTSNLRGVERTNYPLTFVAAPGPALAMRISYDRRRFDTPTIARMLGHLDTLLGAIVAHPEARLTDLPLLSSDEWHELMVTRNATRADYRRDSCYHQLVEHQTARTPDAVAVVFDGPGVRGQGSGNHPPASPRRRGDRGGRGDTKTGRQGDKETEDRRSKIEDRGSTIFHPPSSILHPQSLTYRELNERANRVAHHLRALGVGPEVRVGICMMRSLEMLIGLLGIFKAGAAFMPLDPTFPLDRMAFMLADAAVPVLLTQQSIYDLRFTIYDLEESASAIQNPKSKIQNPLVICLDTDWPAIAELPQDAPTSAVCADNLAYVIYTSGSTGRPKGVMIPHYGLINYLDWCLDAYTVAYGRGGPVHASIAADAIFPGLFAPLMVGSAVIVFPEQRPLDALATYLQQAGWFSMIKITPSQLDVLNHQLPEADAHRWVRTLVVGAEAVRGEVLRYWQLNAPQTRLLDEYGPTETVVGCSIYEVPQGCMIVGQVPIGLPIANIEFYVLDKLMRPVPVGVPGELYIGGDGVAWGYLNRPDLTAERFVPNPFTEGIGDGGWGMEDASLSQPAPCATLVPHPPSPGTRLYRTGDLVQYVDDRAANIEFLGRIDDQVKILGYRIEPGEVETVLEQHPAVHEAVAIAREDVAGDKRLVAYVVTSNKSQVTSSAEGSLVTELRGFLKERLPEYMVPSAFVVLEKLPLAPHGKIDRKALPAPEGARPEDAGAYVAPRTPLEELLAQLWADVLHVERVGIYDRFFALGGHSLLATQVISRVRGTLNVEVPLRALFEAPTVAGLAERISAARRDPLARQAPPLVRVPRDASGTGLPLSFAQQRLWFLDQLEPNKPLYNVPSALGLSGPLDVAALWQSMTMIAARHAILRTTFVSAAGQPAQLIAEPPPLSLPLIDLRLIPAELREAVALRLARAEAMQPFDLARGPLLRVTLLRLADDEHFLLLTMHHIVSDGWSVGVFVRELTTCYAAYRAGAQPDLPALPVQYVDYAVWQRAWLHGPVLEEQQNYWKQQLGNLALLNLPTDRPRPPLPTFQGASYEFMLPAEHGSDLLAFSRRERATLFMTLLTTFQVLLARYSDQDDVAVGTDVANRTRGEIEPLIGFFINQLVLRADLSGNPSFRAALKRVREMTLSAYTYQDLPFEQLVADLNVERHLNMTPLFQVKFILQNAPTETIELPGLTLRAIDTAYGRAQFDLVLSLQETPEGICGSLDYSTDLFDPDTITRMAGHYRALLEAVVADPERRIGELPLLTAAERQAVRDWNATQADYPRHRCFHHLVEEQAARRPDAVALVFDGPSARGQGSGVRGQADKQTRSQESGVRSQESEFLAPNPQSQPAPCATLVPNPQSAALSPQSSVLSPQSLTYAELNARANQVAHELQSYGVGPEVLVALAIERSVELVIALLGVLKAGGAYVPLDPRYPPERLAFMLEDSRAAVLLSQHHLIDNLPTTWGVTLSLDANWPSIAQQATDNPEVAVGAHSIAYVIYTSGSTGAPKGVAVTHCGLCNLSAAQVRAFELRSENHVLQFASLSFDASIFEIVMALAVGATLHLAASDDLLPGPALVDLLRRQAITIVTLPPSALAALPMTHLPDLRTIVVAGESCPPELVERWATGRNFFNAYGPTEATVWSTVAACVPAGGWPPIGRPIANTQIYLLDKLMQPVPIGVPGELYIGGAGLARGYLGRPDLTAERFIPNPFTDFGLPILDFGLPEAEYPIQNPKSKIQNGTRLYKTGDRARYRADGQIEYLGRADTQVKLRGFRIELGEIEAALVQHPAIEQSVVVAREDAPGEKRLVAYVVPKIEDRGLKIEDSASDAPDPLSSILYPRSSELRDFLKDKLPDYMIPTAFVLLEALPLLPNGKINRRALPAPNGARPELAEHYQPPRTPAEELLANIWADVLRLERIGVHDNVFTLGGHSLLATQVIARVRDTFQVELPLRALFEAPTIARLAERIVEGRGSRYAPPLVAAPREGPVPLSFAQQRLWFLDQLDPENPAYNVPAALRLRGQIDLAALERALSAIVARHETLRTTFAAELGQPVQIIHPAAAIRFSAVVDSSAAVQNPLFDLAGLPDEQREATAYRLAAAEAARPFDLSNGPLLRVTLLRLAGDEHILLLLMHHIISDGWSVGVLLRELAALYVPGGAEPGAPLPDLPIQYADYAIWQRAWLQGSGVRGQAPGVRSQESGVRSQESESSAPNPQSPIPNPQSPIPDLPSPIPHPPSPIEEQLAYWKQELVDLPTLNLPTDRPRPRVSSFHGANCAFALPVALSAELGALARRESATLFMVVLAAWQLLLARYSGQDDIVVGTTIANRSHVVAEPLIGCFMNTLVLRTGLSGNMSVRELIERVRAVCLDAFGHQELPFEQLVEELQPQRDLGRQPLFQVLIELQNALSVDLRLRGLEAGLLELDQTTAKYDLSLALAGDERELTGVISYATDLFDVATVERIARHFQVLVEGFVADAARRGGELPLLSAEEWQELVVARNDTAAAYPAELCFHDLFAAQAARTPDAVALVFDRDQGSGARGQGDPLRGRGKETRPAPSGNEGRQGDKQTRRQESGVRSRESEFLAPNPQSPIPNPQSLALSPQSSVLSPERLTYRELEARANQLAHYLRGLGVRPGECVGICMERSFELVVALLAIFKAGAAFVPIEPAFPRERIAYIMSDAQLLVLLTQQRIYDLRFTIYDLAQGDDQIAAIQNPKSKIQNPVVVCLDVEWQAIARLPAEAPAVEVSGADLAYLIYTSGSTGRPKGVLIPHSGLNNYLLWCIETYTVRAGRGAPLHASIAADAIFPSLFAPLLVGTSVVLFAEQRPLDALAAELTRVGGFSMIKITPSQLEVLNHQLPETDARGWVRTLVVGAEALRGEVLTYWHTHAPDTVLLNEYGPTETVVGCSIYQIERPLAGAVPIGLPIANTQFYVLDKQMQVVPVGVPGELYIGGDGVAWGYLKRPELTAERFVPNPFAEGMGDKRSAGGGLGWGIVASSPSPIPHPPSPGTRLYKTGDLVMYLGDRAGNIVFLGRMDDQVKIRGYRVEPGEIEVVLGQHPQVWEVAVLAREDVPGSRRLVAYVAPDPAQPPTIAELRGFVQGRLPEYMVPSAFVLLDALPLTPHGKVNRHALPAPDSARPELESAFVAPRVLAEQTLAQIWAEVLRLEQVGIHDNFFALGGDSILSIQVIARARQAGLRITPRQLFLHQTVAELATVTGVAEGQADEQGLVEGQLPLTPIQRWFFERDLPDAQHYNQVQLLELRRSLDPALLEQAIARLLQHHDALRLRFVRLADGWRQRIAASETGDVFARVDLSALADEMLPAAIAATAAAAQASLDLTNGPIVRVIWFDCGVVRSARLLIIIHHLAVDAVSWGAILEDLQTAYIQLSCGDGVVFPPKTTSFKRWAERLTVYAQSSAVRGELDYWLAPWRHEVARLPLDHPDGANSVASADGVSVTLNAEATRALLTEVPTVYQTQINDVLLTALAQAFARWTGTPTLVIDLEGHGREELFTDVDLSRTVGWYTTLYPVRLDLNGVDDPGAALRTIKEQLRAMPRRGIGYGVLRYLSDDPMVVEGMRALPQAQVSFNYLGQFIQAARDDSLFRPAAEESGPLHSARGVRSHLLEINGYVINGELRLEWTYSTQLHDRATIKRLAEGYLTALRELIAHCQSPDAGGFTPSDFPKAKLNQKDLDKFFTSINRAARRQSK